jgi:hypothetical protein
VRRTGVSEASERIVQPFSQQTAHSAHEFRRAAQGLSFARKPWLIGRLPLHRGGMEFFCMSTNDLEVSPASVDSATNKAAAKSHPAPSMLWMLLPVALLALLAYLSR